MSERGVHAASEATPGTENAIEFASPANNEYEPHITVDVLQGKEKGMRLTKHHQFAAQCMHTTLAELQVVKATSVVLAKLT